MSWSCSSTAPIQKADGGFVISGNDISGFPQTSPDGCYDAYRDQYEAASDAVVALAAVVGRPNDSFTFSISGHANPDHAPYPGYSDEFISIHIYMKPPVE